MGILSKAKSKLKSVVNTAAKKVYNTVNSAVSKVSNVASVVQAKPSSSSSSKVTIPSVPAGPQSKLPASNIPSQFKAAADAATKAMNDAKVMSIAPKNQSTIPSPSAKQIVTDPKTGKTSMVDVTKPKIDVQGAIDKATGGKSGGQSRVSNQSIASDAPIETVSSYGAVDTNFGLGDFEVAADEAFSSTAPSSPSSSSSRSSSSTSKSSGGGSSSAPTSSRGVNTQSARDQALSSAKAEAERLAKEVGLLSAKDESAAQDAIVSDTTEVQDEKDAMKRLKDVDLTPSRKALNLLNEEIKRNEENLRNELSSIGGAYDVKKTGMEGDQLNETGVTSVGIANAGGYLGFSGSGTGVMLKLAESHRSELTALESERQQALQEARTAAANRRFDIVRLKADEIARIDQETYERTREYNSEVKKEAEKQVSEAKTAKTQTDIFNAIQGGAKTASDIFKKLGGKTDINEINDFLEQMTPSSGKSGFKFTANETAGFLGSGMSQDDISALQEYVNENGYDETVRNNLTPAQRAIADEVYGRKTGNNSSTSFTTEDGVAISDTTMQVLDGFTTLKALTPTAAAKVRSELYALGFGSDTVPDWFDAGTVTEMMGVELTQEFLEGFYKLNMEPSVIDAAMNKYTNRFIQDAWKNYRTRVFSEKPAGGGSSSGGGGGLSDINEDDL